MRTKRIFAVITAAIVISCGIGFTNAEAAELKLKKSGSEVKALQLELITLGYLDNAHPTGYYGEATKKAVASFQKDNGLKADGIAGSKTTSAIKKKLIKPDITKVYGPGDVSEEVSALQQLLVKKGYLASFSVSGVYGEVTRNAVKKYQADNKLKSDGIAGRNTLAKLMGIKLDGSSKTDYTKPDSKRLEKLYATLNEKQRDEIDLLSHLIYAEAGNECYEGLVAVGSVVMNRMEASGKSMHDVIYQKNAFSVVKSGSINKTPTAICRLAAIDAYFGARPVSTAQFFNMKNITDSWAAKNRKLYRIIGCHAFYI